VRIDAKKRGGSGKRAGPKIEKRQGGKEARGKEPLSRRGILGKDVEERIRGDLGVLRDASQHRTSFEWHQITLKRGPVQGRWRGGQKKKVRD
jgi:hypothetical protein